MKWPENQTFTALYLSDVHFLLSRKVRSHAHKDLLLLLDELHRRQIRFKNIYLVGDIIENWYFSGVSRIRKKKKRIARLFDRLDRLARPKSRKYYIIGNHDSTRFDMQLDRSIQRYLDRRGWLITDVVRKKRLVVLHGHQGQYNRLSWIFDIAIVRFMHSLSYLWPGFLQKADAFYDRHLNRRDPRSPEENLAYYQRLSSVARQGKRVLISGHTHRFLGLPELRILNTGDWMQSRTFIIQNGNHFKGYRGTGRKKYKVEFEYTF